MFLIGITGISCCGKTYFSKMLSEKLGNSNCLIMSMDNYYKKLTKEQLELLHKDDSALNFDSPNAIDFDLLYNHLNDLKSGRKIRIPNLDLGTMTVSGYTDVPVDKYKFVIIEGIMLFCKPEIAKLCNIKLWIDASEYICALRRMMKFTQDIEGYSQSYTYNQCLKYVIPGQEQFVKPQKNLCEFFVNGDQMDKNAELLKVFILNNK